MSNYKNIVRELRLIPNQYVYNLIPSPQRYGKFNVFRSDVTKRDYYLQQWLIDADAMPIKESELFQEQYLYFLANSYYLLKGKRIYDSPVYLTSMPFTSAKELLLTLLDQHREWLDYLHECTVETIEDLEEQLFYIGKYIAAGLGDFTSPKSFLESFLSRGQWVLSQIETQQSLNTSNIADATALTGSGNVRVIDLMFSDLTVATSWSGSTWIASFSQNFFLPELGSYKFNPFATMVSAKPSTYSFNSFTTPKLRTFKTYNGTETRTEFTSDGICVARYVDSLLQATTYEHNNGVTLGPYPKWSIPETAEELVFNTQYEFWKSASSGGLSRAVYGNGVLANPFRDEVRIPLCVKAWSPEITLDRILRAFQNTNNYVTNYNGSPLSERKSEDIDLIIESWPSINTIQTLQTFPGESISVITNSEDAREVIAYSTNMREIQWLSSDFTRYQETYLPVDSDKVLVGEPNRPIFNQSWPYLPYNEPQKTTHSTYPQNWDPNVDGLATYVEQTKIYNNNQGNVFPETDLFVPARTTSTQSISRQATSAVGLGAETNRRYRRGWQVTTSEPSIDIDYTGSLSSQEWIEAPVSYFGPYRYRIALTEFTGSCTSTLLNEDPNLLYFSSDMKEIYPFWLWKVVYSIDQKGELEYQYDWEPPALPKSRSHVAQIYKYRMTCWVVVFGDPIHFQHKINANFATTTPHHVLTYPHDTPEYGPTVPGVKTYENENKWNYYWKPVYLFDYFDYYRQEVTTWTDSSVGTYTEDFLGTTPTPDATVIDSYEKPYWKMFESGSLAENQTYPLYDDLNNRTVPGISNVSRLFEESTSSEFGYSSTFRPLTRWKDVLGVSLVDVEADNLLKQDIEFSNLYDVNFILSSPIS